MSNYINAIEDWKLFSCIAVFERVTNPVKSYKESENPQMWCHFYMNGYFTALGASANDSFHSVSLHTQFITSHCCSRYYAGKSCMCPRITVTVGTDRQSWINLKGGVVILMSVCMHLNKHTHTHLQLYSGEIIICVWVLSSLIQRENTAIWRNSV